MKFITFLEEKIFLVLEQIAFLIVIAFIFSMIGIKSVYIALTIVILAFFMFLYLIIEYSKQKRKYKKIISLVDNLEEKYLITEIIDKPTDIESQSYYYALKQACKAMNDKISELEKENADYQEYVESFAHEIKTPISAISLTLDNNKDYSLKQEIDKINQLVEQILYYARSGNTEKDYFVKEIDLAELIHTVILKYRYYMLDKKITLNIHDIDYTVFTDEKWLIFIISQIIQNSIKYLDKDKKEIEIWGENNDNNVRLFIKDNGCGIKESDLLRVFEKGFTGTNRKKEHSTGMGLYLSKKLSDRLGLQLQIHSKETEFTKLVITFPKSKLHNIND